MRTGFCGILLLVLLPLSLDAQTASAPAPAPKLLQITLPPLSLGAPTATSELDAYLFLPKNPLANPSTILPKETRTPAQLEALLANYVGKWRGESVWLSTATGHVLRAPTEMVYALKKENGRTILSCTITYDLAAGPSVALARLWVEKGHIFSEITQGDRSQKFIAQSSAGSLLWRTYDSMDTIVEFAETETLRLAADGGQISSRGFEVQHYARGQSLVVESTELKFVK
jgi:hypothetical protein